MRFFLFLSFVGCTLPPSGELFQLSPTKQKQKIVFLQKKIERAEKAQKRVEETVEQLREEMEQAERLFAHRIVEETAMKIQAFEEDPTNWGKLSDYELSQLFAKERTALRQVIQSDSSPASLEAQRLLDQILRLIANAQK